ncbi:TlpA family protein disulfide reductase [Myroides sp. LJL116]
MDDKARESHFGKALKKELDILGRLQPGADAPDFELTALDGSKVSLKDFKGTYVLLYHWGVCPGSFQRENDIVQFQNQYKDKVSVIGITDNILEIEQLYDQTNENAKSYGMSVKPILKSMLAHPWLEVEKVEANKQMLEDYPFASLPYFVFISPQGKIISRGSHKTFFKAKEMLELDSNSI